MSKANVMAVNKLGVAPVSVKANLRKQVKRSGRSQNSIQQKGIGFCCAVSVKANLRKQVKRSGRSQNCCLQRGLPA